MLTSSLINKSEETNIDDNKVIYIYISEFQGQKGFFKTIY